jgi:hypothetical protein
MEFECNNQDNFMCYDDGVQFGLSDGEPFTTVEFTNIKLAKDWFKARLILHSAVVERLKRFISVVDDKDLWGKMTTDMDNQMIYVWDKKEKEKV